MMGNFSKQIGRFNDKFERRYRAVARTAVQDTVAIAQRPRGAGGRMPVVTSFLRASIAANVGSMPSGESVNPGGRFTYTGTILAESLLKWRPEKGEVLYVGWVAQYSRYMEARYGFLRGATEVWDITVAKAAKKVKNSGL